MSIHNTVYSISQTFISQHTLLYQIIQVFFFVLKFRFKLSQTNDISITLRFM